MAQKQKETNSKSISLKRKFYRVLRQLMMALFGYHGEIAILVLNTPSEAYTKYLIERINKLTLLGYRVRLY